MNDPLKFLQHFGDNFWLQTFDDKKKDKTLVGDWFVSFEDTLTPFPMHDLEGVNNKNAGIYFCVNQLKHIHKKRTADNVEAIRAFFVDLDGADCEPVLRGNLLPNIEVCSSNGRWHYYWIMEDFVAADRRLFKELQRTIAVRFNGDPSVSDLCRVMRLPGFYNMKGDPFMVTYKVLRSKPYSLKEVRDEFLKGMDRTNIDAMGNAIGGNIRTAFVADWTLNALPELAGDQYRGGKHNFKEDMDFDSARLRGALIAIDPDQYDVWIEVMLALKGAAYHGDDGLTDEECYEYFLEWSRLSPKFDEAVCEQKWQGTISRGEIRLGTVYKMAGDNGWKGYSKMTTTAEEGVELFKRMNGLL